MEHIASARASVPISLHDWIRTANDSSYVESAVDVAWLLTKRLCEIIESSAESKVEDLIAVENVVVYLRPHSLTLDGMTLDGIGRVPCIVGAKFLSEVSSMVSLPSKSKGISIALGELLLEIFSRGQSDSYNSFNSDNLKNGSSVSTQTKPPAQEALTPKGKQQATLPVSNSTYATANNLLISVGMPLSICQLVCDLLGNGDGNELDMVVDVTLVAEALWDLLQMKNSPQKFLFDRTCPQRALDDTCLFDNTDAHFVGREREWSALTTAKNNISKHIRAEGYSNHSSSNQVRNFLVESVFLSGYAGIGKSRLLHSLIRSCEEDQWFVLGCKFDKRAAPHMVLTKAFDDFFGKWGPNKNGMYSSVDQVCRIIFSALDGEGIQQLCDLLPNFAIMFPVQAARNNNKDQDGISSLDKIGSAKQRLANLFHVLLNSLCSTGRPVLFTFDDLQWAESFVMEYIADFVVEYIPGMSGVTSGTCGRGLLIAGTYRSNEVNGSDNLIRQINFMKQSGRANVTMLNVSEMSATEITKLISAKLCLPLRYTQKLANLVHTKTRGNPFFVVQFLQSIVQNKMLSFSVKSRQWTWDCDVLDMQMISEGVAELLIASFSQLSPKLMQTVKIISCLGSQVEESTIAALDLRNEFLTFNLQDEMPLTVREGIMEKAGPLYQFTHDIIQTTIYELIPPDNRKLFHKSIGMNLLKSAENNSSILIAVDQINMFCKISNPTQEERCRFASNNALAAKLAIASSSFDQARSYIDNGIQLLEKRHWVTQYSLSLDLFEMSASISCMKGDVSKMSGCLDEILSHARTFDDSLKALGLRVKLLASSSRFAEARTNCFNILTHYGETFPWEVSLPDVLQELSSMSPKLRGITKEKMTSLPKMTDKNKLNVMKFLNMLCNYCFISEPNLVPKLSCRMITLTMEYGFSDEDSVVGLATAGRSVFNFTDDIQLASHIGKVSDSLVEESPKKHALRSRLCVVSGTLQAITEPVQSTLSLIPQIYNSAMLSGDVENAMSSRYNYCHSSFWAGAIDLSSLSKQIIECMKRAAKYQQNTVSQCCMAGLNSCSFLSGYTNLHRPGVEVKSFDELEEIGKRTNNHYLSYHIFMNRLALNFWMREYKDVVELSVKHAAKHPSSQMKRIMNIIRTLYEGIAYLNLARDTKQAKWKMLGERAVAWMHQFELMSKWNFENKSTLLKAELHHLEGSLELAEASYVASIKSAREHRFLNEEALAYELYGIFCVENQMSNKGSKQLHVALEKYKQWGAMKKAKELQLFMSLLGCIDRNRATPSICIVGRDPRVQNNGT